MRLSSFKRPNMAAIVCRCLYSLVSDAARFRRFAHAGMPALILRLLYSSRNQLASDLKHQDISLASKLLGKFSKGKFAMIFTLILTFF